MFAVVSTGNQYLNAAMACSRNNPISSIDYVMAEVVHYLHVKIAHIECHAIDKLNVNIDVLYFQR